MRRLAALALVVVAGLGGAFAQEAPRRGGGTFVFDDDDDTPPAPRIDAKLFQGIAAGDWSVLVRRSIVKKRQRVETIVFTIDRADEKELGYESSRQALGLDLDDPGKSTASALVRGAERDDVRVLLSALHLDVERAKIADVATTKEEKKLGDRAFACAKVSFAWQGKKKAHPVTVWLAADVKGAGVVAIETEGSTYELAGFGTKGKTLWGKTEKELQDEVAAKALEEIEKAKKGR